MIDLHVHSNKSDGTFSPTELVQYGAEKGLTAMALTDHDTTEGLAEAINAAASLSLTVIPGIEFSTVYDNKDVHVLGLFIDYDSPVFQEALKGFVNSRILRNEKMCRRLQEKGIDLSNVAVERNGEIVPKRQYDSVILTAEDRLEIVSFVGGG